MRIASVALAGLLLAGCAGPFQSGPDAEAGFASLSDDFLGGYLAWRPQLATSLGIHQYATAHGIELYDGKISDFSNASIHAELARLRSFGHQLAEIDVSRLKPQSAWDYRILRNVIAHEIFGIEQQQVFAQNPMTYAGAIDVNIYIKRNFAPLPNRVRAIINILNQTPAVMATARANLEESLPRPFVETAIEQANGSADFLGADLVAALADVKDQPLLMAEFNTANRRAIDELHKYAAWLKDEKLPKANEKYALGRPKYVQLLEYGEMITLMPEQLLELGQRELARKQAVFADTARQIDPAQKPIDVFNALKKEHPSEQRLIADTARDLDGIRQFVVARHLVTIPSSVRPGVIETPQYLRATSFASMDTPGPFETKATEAWYYVTPTETNWSAQQKEEWLGAFNYYTTDIVSIHEAYPGHYIQFLHLNASAATPIEKIFGSYAFVEGWAHYCEQMVVDEGFGATAKANPTHEESLRAAKFRLAQTDEALLRICRLCVSIKMHCQGMTVEDAAKFFQDNCYYDAKPAHDEAMRATFDPEYLYYTVGKLEFLKLRDDYQKQEGSRFNLEKFHDELLSHGMPPIRLLREVMLKDHSLWSAVL